MRCDRHFASCLALLLVVGCGSRTDAEHVRGSEGNTCYPNRTCDAGLFCDLEDRCVDLEREWCGFADGPLILNGAAAIIGTRLRLVDGEEEQISSAFCESRVPISTFTTAFSVHIPLAIADGMTFTVQNDGPNAIGDSGGGLGFGGDPDEPAAHAFVDFSVAVKLDFFDNIGEGTSSTGVYINGADPALPATDLLPAGIDLQSGHEMRVNISFADGTLVVGITDTETGATFWESYAVDLPRVVADNQAWVGFTAATGGQAAVIDAYDWTVGP